MYQLNHVSFGYEERLILKDISLTFPSTGLVFILGKSGSGKTTLLSLLTSVLKPTKGTIHGFEGDFGIVFQSPLLLSYLNVRENVELPLLLKGEKREELVKSALRSVGLHRMEERDVTTLSGGEQMRVSISRALVMNGSLLILDEPTGQLDRKNSLQIYDLLQQLSLRRLVLIVSHDEENAWKYADVLYELKDGKLIERKNSLSARKAKRREEKENTSHLSLLDSYRINQKSIKKKRIRVNIACFFFAFILSLFYLGLNVRKNLSSTIQGIIKEYYAYEVNTITKSEEIAENGRLHLKRYSVPSQEELVLLDIQETYPPLSYFLLSNNEILIQNKTKQVSFYPFFHQDSSKLSSGSISKRYNEVIVNQNFLDEFGLSLENYSLSFEVHHSLVMKSSSLRSSDLVALQDEFQIVGVAKEMKTFNSPVVYYSYNGYYDKLSKEYLKNISEEIGKLTSITDLLENPLFLQDDFNSSSRLFLSEDTSMQKSIIEKHSPDSLSITSQVETLRDTVTELTDSLAKVFSIFLLLNLLSALMLEFMTVYSLYTNNLRLFALEKAFKAKRRSKINTLLGLHLYLAKKMLLLFFLFSSSFTFLLKGLLASLSLPLFVQRLDIPLLLLLSFLTLILSLFSSLLPFLKIKQNDLKKELEGED